MKEAPKLPIQMIANRDHLKDNNYGTGEWTRGQIQLVDAAVAMKMIRHTDVFVQSTAEEAAASQAKAVKTEVKNSEKQLSDEASQELRDRVGQMNRDQAIEYAAVHYGLKIRGNASVEDARAQLIQHIDLAGPQ
jgi:hypothetical protein